MSSVTMYFFVSHFEILSILKLIEVAGMGVHVYLFMMFLLGGFRDHELSLIKKYLFEVKNSLAKIIGI